MLQTQVDLLEMAIQTARCKGIEVRGEWLDGTSGGFCRIGQVSVIFHDISLTAAEQLDQVLEALRLAGVDSREFPNALIRR